MIERPSKTGPGTLAHGLVMKTEPGDVIAREEADELTEVLCMTVHGQDYPTAGAKKGCPACRAIVEPPVVIDLVALEQHAESRPWWWPFSKADAL